MTLIFRQNPPPTVVRPARRAGGHGLFDFRAFVVYWDFIIFISWRQGCFRDPRRSSMRICFQTLAHERSGLSLHSSDMVYISSWRSWRLQARCTIPSFSFFVFLVKLSYCYHIISTWINWNRKPPWIWPVQETHSGDGAAKGDLSKKVLWNSGGGKLDEHGKLITYR